MTTWTKQKLGDIYKFQYGKGNANPSNGGKYPVYGAGNIIGYFDEYNAENSPVIGHMGANCGKVIFGKGKHFVTYNGIMALIKEGSDSLFGYYVLLSKDFGKSIRGSAQPFISYDLLNNVDIDLPDFLIQMRISGVLSAYDNLIENNEKRIIILETMAQRLFVEWFEKLKFPGYEKTVMVDSELGQIPEGWKVSKLSGISNIISGYPFKSSTYKKTGKYKIVTIKNVQAGEFVLNFDSFLEDLPANLPADCVLEQGDILLSLTGNVGRICTVLGEDHVLNQRVAKINPKNGKAREYVYYMFSADQFRKKMEAFSNGAAQQNLSPVQLANFKTLIPGEEVLANFHNIVSYYFNLSLNLKEQNQALSKMRDLLIPQLITGRKELKN